MMHYVTKLMVSNEDMIYFTQLFTALKMLSFCIELIGHLSPWNYHESRNVHSPNGGMPHLLFLVAMRALGIDGLRRPFPQSNHLQFFKPKAPSCSLDSQRTETDRGDMIISVISTVNVPIVQTIGSNPPFFPIRRRLFAFMAGDGLKRFLQCWSRLPRVAMCVAAP